MTRSITIMGEVAQAHDGSLGLAHRYLDAVADAGADGVKFQTHIASAESTPGEPWRVKFSTQDESRFDYWKRMEFSEDQWVELKQHADERALRFYSSPFSLEAVDLLARVGVAGWKVASGEVTHQPMLERMAATGLPLIVSTGMSSLQEVDELVARLSGLGVEDVTLLQCASLYPTPPKKIGLNVIPLYRERYGCKVGLSDHSGTIFAGLAAAAIGIDLLEVHVVFNRGMFGPDVSASVTTDELRTLVEGVRFIEQATQHPVDKDDVADELEPMRALFTKSVVVRVPLEVGTVLQVEHLALKKPGTGIPAGRLEECIGRRLVRAVDADQLLADADLE